MDELDVNTRVQIIRCYYAAGGSPIACLRQYKKEMKQSNHITSEATVRRLIQRFETTGSVHREKSTGRPRVSDENVKKWKKQRNNCNLKVLLDAPLSGILGVLLQCRNLLFIKH